MGIWVKGEKVMEEYDLPARILGDACWLGELAAYTPEFLQRIYDAYWTPRIPKYPPPGFDSRDFRQIGGKARWNWEVLTVLPVNYKDYDPNKGHRRNPEYEINSQAAILAEIQCRKKVGENVSSEVINSLARILMMTEYNYLVRRNVYSDKYKDLFFNFNFEIYLNNSHHLSINEAEAEYRKSIANMRFKKKRIDRWIYKRDLRKYIDNEIAVRTRVASINDGEGHSQLKNTIKENQVAFDIIRDLIANGVSKLDILKKIRGGRTVAACLLFPESQSPEAAYRALLRSEKKPKN